MQIRRPTDDEQRVQTLHALNILDQQPDPQFQDITKLVATIFRVSHFHAWQLATVLQLLMTYPAALPTSPRQALVSAVPDTIVPFI